MPFPYRLAAIDLDDTLLAPDKTIHPANAVAVQRLRAVGVHVTLASGRRHENMLRFHRQLELEGPIVSCNGALVKDAETNAVLHQRLLPSDRAAEIVAFGDDLHITQNYYHQDGGLYVREKTRWTDLYQSRTASEIAPIGDLERLHGESALKVIWIDEPARISALHAEMAARFPDLYVTITDAEYLEFMASGVSKAVGAAVVAERLGVARQQALAFGDGHNDVPLLEWAGTSFAMAGGRESARRAASHVAPPGEPETSFARAVDRLFTIAGAETH